MKHTRFLKVGAGILVADVLIAAWQVQMALSGSGTGQVLHIILAACLVGAMIFLATCLVRLYLLDRDS